MTERIDVYIKFKSGDELVIEIESTARIAELKHEIAVFNPLKYKEATVERLRLVLMHVNLNGGPFELLADSRSLSACGIASGTVLELVVLDEPLPPFYAVRFFSRMVRIRH